MTTSGGEAGERGAMGPVSYLVAEFPGSKMTGEGFSALVDLVDRGLIRILDLRFVTRDMDGSLRALELADVDAIALCTPGRRRPYRTVSRAGSSIAGPGKRTSSMRSSSISSSHSHRSSTISSHRRHPRHRATPSPS